MKRILTTLWVSLFYLAAVAQDKTDNGIEMADALRASGKIYVVVLVLVVIVAGLFIYLIKIDKKLNRFEKEFKSRLEK